MNNKISISTVVIIALLALYCLSDLPGAGPIRSNFLQAISNSSAANMNTGDKSTSAGTLQASRETTQPDQAVETRASREISRSTESAARYCTKSNRVPVPEEPVVGTLQEQALINSNGGVTISIKTSEYCLIRLYEVEQEDGKPALKVVRQIVVSGATLPPRGTYNKVNETDALAFSSSSGREENAFVIHFFRQGSPAPNLPGGIGSKGILEVPLSAEDFGIVRQFSSLSIAS